METSQQAPQISQAPQQLASLSDIITANTDLARRAEMSVRPQIDALKIIDFTSVEATAITVYDGQLNDLMIRLGDSKKINEDRRKPLTQKFDEIRSIFTAQENKIAALADECKNIRVRIASEVNRRQQLELQKQRKEGGKIIFKQFICENINQGYISFLSGGLLRMRDKYNSCTNLDELTTYTTQLTEFVPALQLLPMYSLEGYAKDSELLNGEEKTEITRAAEAEMFPRLAESYAAAINAEKDRILTEAPTRDFTVAPPAPATLESVQETVNQEEALLNDIVQTEAVTATFENVAEMQPTIQAASGTKIKKKYQPVSHKAHVAIIQWWVTNKMHLMTLEELQTKLSFMRTAADKALNEGETITGEGLQIVDDINTRVKRA